MTTNNNDMIRNAWIEEKLKGMNSPSSKLKEIEKLFKSLAKTDGEAEANQEKAFANSSVKRFETWNRIGCMYLKLVDVTSDLKNEKENAPTAKDVTDKICKATSLRKGMILRCVNIAKFANQFPVAHKMFLTSLDKENIFKVVKKAESDTPTGEGADRKQVEIDRRIAMVSVLEAIEALDSNDKTFELPAFNAKGTKTFVKDFTNYKDREEDDKGNLTFQIKAFENVGMKLFTEYGATLLPRRAEKEPDERLSAEHIRMYKDVLKDSITFSEGADGDKRQATITEKHLATAIMLLLKQITPKKAFEPGAETKANDMGKARDKNDALNVLKAIHQQKAA